MLKALYDYALRHDLTLPDGYVKKTVKAYISLSSVSPEYVDIYMGEEEAIPCPNIGSLANGTDKSNVIVEKRSVVIPDAPSSKSDFFRDALVSCGELVPEAKRCADALKNDVLLDRIRLELDRQKIKPSDRISFMVDHQPILAAEGVQQWWQEFRKQFKSKNTSDQVPCVITGELTTPVATVPPINGLHAVGGHARGDALICFDKNAFCSYGLKQAENAPVSETAIGAVKTALDDLLEDAPVLAGMKFVHWYDCDIPPKDDPVLSDELFRFDGMDVDDDADEFGSGEMTEQDERDARRTADRLIQSVNIGGASRIPPDMNYHILLLTGVGGRVMVRRYERGRYEELQKNLAAWEDDLRLDNAVGKAPIPPQKLRTRLGRLLKYQKTDKKFLKRLQEELSGLTPAILAAVLNGTELPDAVAVRALAYIRSGLLSADDNGRKKETNLDGWACQWLKVWLIRKDRENKEYMMEKYNMNHPNPAYHCGGMMAVYAAIQQAGYEGVNVNVVQRYYASAIQTPALVLGRLSQMSVHHLEKIEVKKAADRYRELLDECSTAIGDRIPITLNLVQQSYFALGYYQMQAKLAYEKSERIAEAKAKADENNQSEE